MTTAIRLAPELQTTAWLNVDAPLKLVALQGKIVVIHVFQMLCAGCVHHSIPLAKRMQNAFDPSVVMTIGLHSVFEHHQAMTPDSLAVFVKEQRITFPVAIDAHSKANGIPLTMQEYGMEGTPTTVLIDQHGRIRLQQFGAIDDLSLGASVGALLGEYGATKSGVVSHA